MAHTRYQAAGQSIMASPATAILNPGTSDGSRITAARVVGLAYLVAIPLALFAEFYVPSRVLVLSDLGATARNIVEHQTLYRAGVAASILVFAVDLVLIAALYVALEPVDRPVALLAAFVRLVETAIMFVAIGNDFEVLRVVSAADYLRAFDSAQLNVLMRLAIGAHGAGYNVGLLLAGLGSTLFCWLWLKSRLVPAPLAAFGIAASLILAVRTITVVVFPQVVEMLSIAWWAGPIFLFELTMGVWLLAGLRRGGVRW